MTLFFMIMLSLIGVAMISLVPQELRSATRNKLDLQAHYAVTSGIREARAWCSAVMTPSTTVGPDMLGDPANGLMDGTSGNQYYPVGGSYNNEVTGVNGTHPAMAYTVMQLKDVFGSGYIPTGNSRWSDVYDMLNIPRSGDNTVDPNTVVVVRKTPLAMSGGDDWSVRSIIIPDIESPGGKNSLTGSKITSAFGGAGRAGRRAYQIISIGYYQGFPTVRAKSTVLEDSFARYSLFVDNDPEGTWAMQATSGQVSTTGPVHTNSFFKFALDPNLWTGGVVPFNGLMTFAENADATNVKSTFIGKDGNRYFGGNDDIGADADKRPFDDNGVEVSGRYSKLMNGRGNLRKVGRVELPPDSAKISGAAYGQNYNIGHYSAAGVASNFTNGGEPDGIFVFPNASNKAAGGVVVKGDQSRMFLEVVNDKGVPITSTAGLEAGTAVGNPAIRAQASKAATGTSITTLTTISGQTSALSTITTGSTSKMVTQSATLTTGSTVTTKSGVSVQYSTFNTTQPVSSVSTLYSTGVTTSTQTIKNVNSNTTVLTTGYTSTGGAGGAVQALKTTVTNYTTQTTLVPKPTTTSVSTGKSTSMGSTVFKTSTSVGQVNTSNVQTLPLTSISKTSFSTLSPLTSVSTSSYFTSTIKNTTLPGEKFNPIDQVIEARNTTVGLNPTMFQATDAAASAAFSSAYATPAGGATATAGAPYGAMDVSKLSQITAMSLLSNGTLSPLGATNVAKGNVVVIKQSRIDPKVAIVTIIPGTPDDEGNLLNGAVLTEGNIGDGKTGGLAGVNYGRKTIGGQIKPDVTDVEAASLKSSFDARPLKSSTYLGVENNVWQFGTKINESDPSALQAKNGLGIVAEEIRINADPRVFKSFSGTSAINYATDVLLNIHAVILGGSQADGGLTIKGYKKIDDITPTNLNSPAGQTPMMRFLGGLILRNYYARINTENGGAGWNSKNIYNQQLALTPPPYFPNNGQLTPLSYVEERIWSEQRR